MVGVVFKTIERSLGSLVGSTPTGSRQIPHMPDSVVIHAAPLREFATQFLQRGGMPDETAALVADSLVASNLRGVDSHGVQLLGFYLAQLQADNIDVQASGRIVSENGPCLVYDGQNGVGQKIADICSRHAARLGRTHGIGFAIARESNHFGAAAYWAQQIADEGCIGIVMCNASSLVAPWQGKDPRFGTNPICMALPGPQTWLLDMATTTVAMGWIFKAHLSGDPNVPAGWAMDSEGVPTTETAAAMSGLLMPLGGYKGYGLAMMVEILCAVLGGGAVSSELGGLRERGRPMRVSQSFLAIDVARIMPLEEFAARMRHLVDLVKSSRPARGYEEVLVAGEPEWRSDMVRREQGIPLANGVWQGLAEAAVGLGVPLPPLATEASGLA